MIGPRRTLFAFLLAALAIPMALAETAHGQTYGVAPHTARYVLKLKETRMVEIEHVEGYMAIKLSLRCHIWSIESDLKLAAGQINGPGFTLSVVNNAREALDGSWLEFDTEVRVDDVLQEAYRGRAEIEAGRGGVVRYELPIQTNRSLVSGTLFPIDATHRSINAIWGRGQKLISYVLFDGSDMEAMRATDIVAGTPDRPFADISDPNDLIRGRAKRIVTTFFDLTRTDSEPRMTYIVDVEPNGVITRLEIDMGYMATVATLVEVKKKPSEDC